MPEQTVPKEQTSRIPGFDAEATPLLGIGLGLTGLALGLKPRLAPLPLALTALTAALYRDPSRVTPNEPGSLFAVADGTVLRIEEFYEHRFIHSDCVRMVISTSPLDVPVSRSPISGVVRIVDHVAGEYRPASDLEAGERNERVYIGIETDWGPVLVTQLAGPLRRRIVCRVQAGDRVEAGARLGTVRFGARTDLIFQRDLVRLLVSPGQHVVAGLTRIGEMMPL